MTTVGPFDPADDKKQAEEKLKKLREARARTVDRTVAMQLDEEIADWGKALRLAEQKIREQTKAGSSDR